MKLNPIPALQAELARGASSISFATGDDFASKLMIGQIIKGRVLRSFEGSRYLVDFNGHQKVVDSAVPLRVDEVIHGRVTGLTERVELQRVNASVAAPAQAEPSVASPALELSGKSGEIINELFARFQAQMAPEDVAILQSAVDRASQPERMALAGLLLAKLGVPVSLSALRAVFDALRTDRRAAMFALPDEAIHLATQPASADANANANVIVPTAAAFSALLSEMLSSVPEVQQKNESRGAVQGGTGGAGQGSSSEETRARQRRSAAQEQQERGKDMDIARLILNVQSGGAVAHRVGTLPLFVDGRLVELNIALFEQSGDRSADSPAALHHRQVVFAVTTETLGRVEVQASIAGMHMRVKVSTEARASAQYLAGHAGRLTSDLESLGWRIDELQYQTTPAAGPGAVAQTVLEHLISPGSVSALA